MIRPGLRSLAAVLRVEHKENGKYWTRDDLDGNFCNRDVTRCGDRAVGSVTTVDYGGNLRIVTAPAAPDEVIEVLCELSASSRRMDDALGTDVLVCVGTIRPGSPSEALIKQADARMLVMRRTIEDISAVIHRRRLLQDIGAWTILTAGGRLSTIEVSRVVHWPVLADLLPSDRQNSAVLRLRVGEFASSLQPTVNPGNEQLPRLGVGRR